MIAANLNNSFAGDIPIACSLSAAELGDREAEWRALLDTSLIRGEKIPAGVRISVRPSGLEELQRLIDLERTCCAWMQFDFEAPGTVSITAAAAGIDVLVAMFLNRDRAGAARTRTS